MANEIIRPTQLPPRSSPVASEVVPSDNGASVGGVSWKDGVNAGRPMATRAEAEAGVVADKAMSPLTTKQAIDAQLEGIVDDAISDLDLVYTDDLWVPYQFSGDGVTSSFILPREPVDGKVEVFVSGEYIQKDRYTVSGGVLTFSEAPPVGADNIEVNIGGADAQEFAIPSNGTVGPEKVRVGGGARVSVELDAVVNSTAAHIPVGISSIKVNGYNAAGDGGGGLAVDVDNGTPVWFTSGGDTSRSWYRSKDIGPERMLEELLFAPGAAGNYDTRIGTGRKAIHTGFNTLAGFNTGGNFGAGAARNALYGHNLASGDTIYPEENAPFTGTDNNGHGYHALKKNQTGNSNNAFGGDALNELKTGNHNCAFGQAAGQQIITQSDGCFFGSAAGGRADSGNGRTALFGRDAGRENRNTSNNVNVGWASGRGPTATSTVYTGDGVTQTFNVPGYVFTEIKQVRVDVAGVNILPANYTVTGTNGQVTLNFAPAAGASVMLTPTIGASSYSEASIVGARSLMGMVSGSRASALGFGAAENVEIVNDSLILGDEAGYNADEITGSIIIGPRAYRGVTGIIANRLVVANQSSTPFIDGTMAGPSHADNIMNLDAYLRPASDNNRPLGGASRRWSVVFSGTGTINTSDERVKQDIDGIPDEWLDAWGDVQWSRFRFKDAVIDKGDGARWHIGLIAQRVLEAFANRGLDATEIGLLCLDKWPEETEEVTEELTKLVEVNGVVEEVLVSRGTGQFRTVREAGELYSLRYDEAFAMEAAWQRRELGRIREDMANG